MKTTVKMMSKYFRVQWIQGSNHLSWIDRLLLVFIVLSPHFNFEIEMVTKIDEIDYEFSFDLGVPSGDESHYWVQNSTIELDDELWGDWDE